MKTRLKKVLKRQHVQREHRRARRVGRAIPNAETGRPQRRTSPVGGRGRPDRRATPDGGRVARRHSYNNFTAK